MSLTTQNDASTKTFYAIDFVINMKKKKKSQLIIENNNIYQNEKKEKTSRHSLSHFI